MQKVIRCFLPALCCAAWMAAPLAAQNNDSLDESGKYPPKPLNLIESLRQRVNDAYAKVHEQPPSLPGRVVYGADDRRDWYEIGAGETVIRALEQAVCVVVSTSEVSDNGDGTYTLFTSSWTSVGGSPVCSGEPFRGQRQIGFCSGFLIGTDIVATAGHCVNSGNCGSVALVFGFDQLGPTTDPALVVPADNVYFCNGVIDRVQAGDLDHCVMRVDRPVVGRTPLPIRRTGIVAASDPLVMIGHPVVLPKKIDDGGVVQNNNGSTGWFYANLDAYGGNSGSMVANLNTGVVEGILVRGNTDFTSAGGCVVSNVCPDSGCPDWEECSKTISFAASVPELGMQVSPVGTTMHIGALGGPFSNGTITYRLSNPTASSLNYIARLVPGGAAPILLAGGTADVSGSIAAGGEITIDVSVDQAAAAALAAGNYSTDIEFEDSTNVITATRTHVVEVGQTGFDVTPSTDLVSGGAVGGPFNGSIVYQITSNRPTAVNVQVTASDSWIALDGGAGPLNFTLTGTGDSRFVTVSFSSDADLLASGFYVGSVAIDNLSGGAGSTTRGVTLDVGRIPYPATDVPQPINDNSTITSQVSVADAICVGDVDVDINITHTYIGDLIIELQSPQGTVVRLHNRTGGSSNDILTTYDDATNPPDGPGLLADFNTEAATGVWTLTISDNAGADTGSLNAWTLRIGPSGGGCPPSALDMAVQVPQNIASPIALQGASPSGPFDTIIMSLPLKGVLSDPAGGPIASVPYTLLGGGATVDYQPAASYFGPDSFTYKVNDGLDSNVATVAITVGIPGVILDFPLDVSPGWSTTGDWAFGQPTGGGSNGGDPSSGFTGSNVYGYNLNGDYANGMGLEYLTTTPLNLTGAFLTQLEFRRWLGVESASFDHATIEISVDGVNWTVLWDHTGGSFSETSWSLQSFDISAIADNQASVQIRWAMGPTDSGVTYPGWNIDDVQIIGLDLTPPDPCPGDVDGNNQVDLTDLAIVLGHFGETGVGREFGDLDGNGNVDLTDLAIVLGQFGQTCP